MILPVGSTQERSHLTERLAKRAKFLRKRPPARGRGPGEGGSGVRVETSCGKFSFAGFQPGNSPDK